MMSREEQDSASASWATNSTANINRDELSSVYAFKPMFEVDEEWYMANNSNQNQLDISVKDMAFSPNFADPDNHLLLHPLDSSSSCSPSSSVLTNLHPSQVQYFLPPKPTFPSLLNAIPSNPYGFDMGWEVGFLEPQASTTSKVLNTDTGLLGGFSHLSSNNQLLSLPNLSSQPQVPQSSVGFAGFQNFEESSGDAMVLNRSKILGPLESLPSSGAQPTLFQKRAALWKNLTDKRGKCEAGEGNDKERKMSNIGEDHVEGGSFDGLGLNYDSDDDMIESNNSRMEENANNDGNSSNANSNITGVDHKGKGKKKKGMPAKNLMAERRRRKKLNDRLYMLRSLVPNISKMDRASILGDAIEYLKELLQRINDLHNELESIPAGSSLRPVSSFHPLSPALPTLPSRMKEELCPSSLPSPNGQPPRVEVRLREGRAVNIHMFCGRKPGLLLSTMRALDNLGLDIQQAVISYFNGFAMDIFRAEQCKEGQDVHPEQIKAVLLDSVGFHSTI